LITRSNVEEFPEDERSMDSCPAVLVQAVANVMTC